MNCAHTRALDRCKAANDVYYDALIAYGDVSAALDRRTRLLAPSMIAFLVALTWGAAWTITPAGCVLGYVLGGCLRAVWDLRQSRIACRVAGREYREAFACLDVASGTRHLRPMP